MRRQWVAVALVFVLGLASVQALDFGEALSKLGHEVEDAVKKVKEAAGTEAVKASTAIKDASEAVATGSKEVVALLGNATGTAVADVKSKVEEWAAKVKEAVTHEQGDADLKAAVEGLNKTLHEMKDTLDTMRTRECPAFCPHIFSQVCASDGVTYNNECLMRVAACNANLNLTVVQEGPCVLPEENVCDIVCTADYVPVCGSDGKTYSNKCELARATCMNVRVVFSYDGECKSVEAESVGRVNKPTDCPAFCTREYWPVCGSNGKTYSNKCVLKQAACESGEEFTVSHEGACEETPAPLPESQPDCPPFCTREFWPVCGSNGETYSNKCVLKQAACEGSIQITIAHEGSCKQKPVPVIDVQLDTNKSSTAEQTESHAEAEREERMSGLVILFLVAVLLLVSAAALGAGTLYLRQRRQNPAPPAYTSFASHDTLDADEEEPAPYEEKVHKSSDEYQPLAAGYNV